MGDYKFRCLGPFHFPTWRTTRGKRAIKHIEARNAVFGEAEKAAARIGIEDIYSAIGLYVMGLSPSGGARAWPYYVGKAAGQPLYKRTFQSTDKPEVYGDILTEYQKARPFMYLFPLVRNDGRQVSMPRAKHATVHKVIDDAEYMLIGMAMRVNPRLWNVQHKVSLERFVIDGTPQAKLRETQDARRFRQMMGFTPKEGRTAADRAMLEASEKAFELEGEMQKDLTRIEGAELELEHPSDMPLSEQPIETLLAQPKGE